MLRSLLETTGRWGFSIQSVESCCVWSGQVTVGIGTRGRLRATGRWGPTFGQHDRSVRSARFLPSEGVTATLALEAINISGLRPWLELSTQGDLVSMLVSAWEPSITHILDSDHSIV